MPGLARRLLGKKACLCTTAKRDSYYDDLPQSLTKTNSSNDQHVLSRSDKPRRLSRQANIDESDGEDDTSITERLRQASAASPANIPMLVVVSFNPDAKGLQKKQIEIQRGFPVNAQFILNEWLFVKTADNEEGFVPYVCCRPMLRRSSIKYSNHLESSYKPYDFQSSRSSHQMKSPLIAAMTPPTNKNLSLSSTHGSQSLLIQNSLLSKKRQDLTSSSCGGDSGFSDGESSSHINNVNQSFDLSTQHYSRLSNIRSLRSSSNSSKRNTMLAQDSSVRKSIKANQSIVSRTDSTNRMKFQLSVSNNSAFTHFIKKSVHPNSQQESNQQPPLHSNVRLFHHQPEASSTSSSICNLRRPFNSYDETRNSASPVSKCPSTGGTSSTVSSPYIRRTPFSRRSLPHHIQPTLKKSVNHALSSSPDPYKITIARKEQQLRHVVLAEPSLPSANTPFKRSIERQFSDLSLNQIENDSLVQSSSTLLIQCRPVLSCSSSSAASASSTSSSSSSTTTDDSTTAFIHIQVNNSSCDITHRGDPIPVVFSTTNNNISNVATTATTTAKSSSFIHNVSITV